MARASKDFHRNYKNHSVAYDQKRFEGKANKYLEMVRFDIFFSLFDNRKKLKVLDVGCGTGRGAIRIGKKGHQAVGVDYTIEMLNVANKKKKSLDLSNVSFEQGSAKELPFPDDSFDCVVAFNFIHMFGIEPQKVFIEEMTRVLKLNGILIIEFDNYYKAGLIGAIVQKQKSRTHFNKPIDFSYLFDEKLLKIEKIFGAGIPFLWRFFMHMPKVAIHIERLSKYYPFKYLVERCFVKAIKIN